MSALSRVEVTNDAPDGDGFQITFTLSKDTADRLQLCSERRLNPSTRVDHRRPPRRRPEVLIDGVITHHQLAPNNEPGTSHAHGHRQRLQLMLDLEEKNEKYENQPDFVIVTQLIAQLRAVRAGPAGHADDDVPIELDRIPRQHETDLRFIQRHGRAQRLRLLHRAGHARRQQGVLGPGVASACPQPALTLDMGALGEPHVAASSPRTRWRRSARRARSSSRSPRLRIPIPSSPRCTCRRSRCQPTPALRKAITRDTAQPATRPGGHGGVGGGNQSPDPVTGEGEIDTVRYGNVLRARRSVGVRGAGLSYDGFYYVRRVTHTDRARRVHADSFRLSREGTGALIARW